MNGVLTVEAIGDDLHQKLKVLGKLDRIPSRFWVAEITGEDGYTMPAVTMAKDDGFELVDGAHRTKIAQGPLKKELRGYMPVSVIEKPIEERMASTIRHNRARGVHGVTPMTSIVAHLASHGWDDDKIAKHLGMDADEALRLKQNSGLPSLFLNREFSKAWE